VVSCRKWNNLEGMKQGVYALSTFHDDYYEGEEDNYEDMGPFRQKIKEK
jgi:hypothetical protein